MASKTKLTSPRQSLPESIALILLVGLIPLAALWKENLGQIQAVAVLKPLLVTLGFVLLVGAFWLLVSHPPGKAAILAGLTLVFFFSFGHLYNIIGGKSLFGIQLGFVKLLAVYLVAFALLLFLALRIRIVPKNLVLGAVAGILLLFNLVPIALHEVRLGRKAPASQAASNLPGSPASTQRDIYFIVLDSYARADVLQQVLGYDNSAFISALKDRGFYIPDCAYSNYDGTELSVSGTLNYDELQMLGAGYKYGQEIEADPNRIIDNRVRTYFKQYGYQFVTGRGYLPANDIANSDIYLNYFIDNKGSDSLSQQRFSALYLNTTLLRVVTELYNENPGRFSKLPYWLSFDLGTDVQMVEGTFWYYQNNYVFDSIGKLPEKPGNYLVYAHINAPHGPYVYQPDGSFQYPMGNPLPPDVEKKLYANEVTWLNQQVLKLVDTLLENSDPKPIIIIQGDHGIHTLTNGLDLHKILSAYYLPGELNTPPYPTITPANDFRLVMQDYFDPSVQLSPDILYVKFKNEYESVASSCDLQP